MKKFKEKVVEDNVWIGAGVVVLLGAYISTESIVAANSVVPEGIYPKRVLIAGNPAKVVKYLDEKNE